VSKKKKKKKRAIQGTRREFISAIYGNHYVGDVGSYMEYVLQSLQQPLVSYPSYPILHYQGPFGLVSVYTSLTLSLFTMDTYIGE